MCIKIFGAMIRKTMNLKKCVVKLGVVFTTYVLLWLGIRKKVNIVLLMKVKTHKLNALPKVKFFVFYLFYLIENVEELENLNEFVSLQNQVNEVRLQDQMGKQNFHGNIKKVLEPLTDTNKNTSEKLIKIITENSFKNQLALENLNNNF